MYTYFSLSNIFRMFGGTLITQLVILRLFFASGEIYTIFILEDSTSLRFRETISDLISSLDMSHETPQIRSLGQVLLTSVNLRPILSRT